MLLNTNFTVMYFYVYHQLTSSLHIANYEQCIDKMYVDTRITKLYD